MSQTSAFAVRHYWLNWRSEMIDQKMTMPKTIKIEKHLTICELEQRYRQAKLGTEKIHYQVIWLFPQVHFRQF